MNRDMLSRRLQRRGHDVVVAVDGAEGLALARREAATLILMDVTLPVLDGWEASRQLKADPATLHPDHYILAFKGRLTWRQIVDAGAVAVGGRQDLAADLAGWFQ